MNVRPTNRRTTLAMVLASIAGVWGLANAQSAPTSVRVTPSDATTPSTARRIRLVTAPEGNEARYRVNEQLVGIDLPSDAVGATNAITGVLVLEVDGTIVSAESKFTIDLTTLQSDQDMRDNFIRRNTLETEQHPSALFVPTAFKGLTLPVPSSGELKFQLVGDLTVHGQTRSVTWDVTARAQGGSYSGAATTVFTFGDFGMTIPRVRRVLSVKDEIKLEYDFRLIPEPAGEF